MCVYSIRRGGCCANQTCSNWTFSWNRRRHERFECAGSGPQPLYGSRLVLLVRPDSSGVDLRTRRRPLQHGVHWTFGELSETGLLPNLSRLGSPRGAANQSHQRKYVYSGERCQIAWTWWRYKPSADLEQHL